MESALCRYMWEIASTPTFTNSVSVAPGKNVPSKTHIRTTNRGAVVGILPLNHA
jgi:hypothetical protein